MPHYVNNKQYTKRIRVYEPDESTFHCSVCNKTMLYVSYYMHVKQAGHIKKLKLLSSNMFPANDNITIMI